MSRPTRVSRRNVHPTYDYGALTLSGRPSQTAHLVEYSLRYRHHGTLVIPQPPSRNAGGLSRAIGLGSSPFARHYWGSRSYFLLLEVLRCFSSLAYPPHPYGFRVGSPRFTTVGLLHSDSSGSTPADGSPDTIVVNHVLLRLLAPRYPHVRPL